MEKNENYEQYLDFVNCNLCGGKDSRLLFKGNIQPTTSSRKDLKHLFACTNETIGQHPDIFECKECGFIYNNPQIKSEYLLKLYKDVVDPRYIQEREGRYYTFKNALKNIKRWKRNGRLLDFGCYTGFFLEQAKADGWETYGIELSDWACKYAREHLGLKVFDQPLSELYIGDNFFDVVCMWDVIEHLTNPVKELREINKKLKPNGLLCISTYDLNSLSARILGSKYPFLMQMHISHFTRKTINRILKETSFKIIEIKTHERLVTLRYLATRLESKNKKLGLLLQKLLKILHLDNKKVKINFIGLIDVFAKKVV